MNHNKDNKVVGDAVHRSVYEAVLWSVDRSVYSFVYWSVYDAVDWPVTEAVDNAVYLAVHRFDGDTVEDVTDDLASEDTR